MSLIPAGVMVDQPLHLVEALPRTLAALAAGTLDRVRYLVDATTTNNLTDDPVTCTWTTFTTPGGRRRQRRTSRSRRCSTMTHA